VIHGLHHEQDMRYMGGVRRAMQFTWAMMLIGTLALIGTGLPLEGFKIGFAGFYSKDAAIEAAYAAGEGGRAFGMFAFWIGILAAFLTSFYSWRLMFMTFEGTFRPNPHPEHHHDDHAHADEARAGHGHTAHPMDDHGHDHGHGHNPALPAGTPPAHESPWVMLGPLAVLAVGAVFAGWFFYPYFIGYKADYFWEGVIHRHDAEHSFPVWVLWAPVVVTAAGFLLAVLIYLLNQGFGAKIARAAGPLNAFLARKWYFDELYDFVFVKGARALGDLFWKGGDQKLIDGLGPNGVANAARFGGRQLRKAQTGFLYHYSFLMLAAAVALGAFAIWAGGGLELLGG
jgi:NADH-quinone oxidoreductase subunit L